MESWVQVPMTKNRESSTWNPECTAWILACENIRFSSLFAAGDVSRGGTSATRRQKFRTDDVKSVRNPVRSADWSMEQLHCFSCCLRMTDKGQKATKVKCKRDESLTKRSIFVEFEHFSFAGARSQMNTTLLPKSTGRNVKLNNLHLEPHDYRIYYVNTDLRHQYGISAAETQTFLRGKRPQRRRAGRNGCFRRLHGIQNPKLS